jgi:hypothetical protein
MLLPLLPGFVLDAGDHVQLINIVTAMATHASDTYGDSRSPNHSKRSEFEQHVEVEGHWDQPILAHFQKRPRNLRQRQVSHELDKDAGKRHLPFFISVHYTWHCSSHVCTCAYQEQKDQEQGLEVEERRLGRDGSVSC